MRTKVDKEDPTDLLPKVTAERMTWRLPVRPLLEGKYALGKQLMSMAVYR